MNAVLTNVEDLIQQCGFIPTEFHFIGTTAFRNLIGVANVHQIHQRTARNGPKKTAKADQKVALQLIEGRIYKALCSKCSVLARTGMYNPDIGAYQLKRENVHFRVLTVMEEAYFESYAAHAAIEFASDLPDEIRAPGFSGQVGSLAWGSGSTQGFPKGPAPDTLAEARTTNPGLALTIGLKSVKGWAREYIDIVERQASNKDMP